MIYLIMAGTAIAIFLLATACWLMTARDIAKEEAEDHQFKNGWGRL